MLSIAVFTVPSRYQRLQRLLESIPQQVTVITDSGDGHWPTAKRAWRAHRPGATHHLVLQDDVIACRDFIPAVYRCIDLAPLEVLSFFSFWKAGHELYARGSSHWLRQRQCAYAQAICLPVELIEMWLTWDQNNLRQDRWTDDNRLGAFCYQYGLMVYTTVPSLVQHEAPSDSVIDKRMNNARRVSPYYIGDQSALDIDWTQGFPGPIIGSTSHARAMLADRDPW